jgi:hypothetical protein
VKRIGVVLLLCAVLTPLASAPILLDLIGLGLDVATTKRSATVIVDGAAITLGGSSVTSMKRSLAEYDFTVLEFSERLAIYDEAKAAIAWPVFRNLLLGFGSGSKSQGDRGGVLAGTLLDSTAVTAVGVGLSLYLIDFLFIAPWSSIGNTSYDPVKNPDELMQIAGGLVIGGLIGLGVGRIIQAVLPISYGTRYNTALRNGLGIDKDGGDALSLSVGLNASDLGIGFSIASRVRF